MNPPKRLDELLISRGAAFLRDQNASTSLEKRVMFLARQGMNPHEVAHALTRAKFPAEAEHVLASLKTPSTSWSQRGGKLGAGVGKFLHPAKSSPFSNSPASSSSSPMKKSVSFDNDDDDVASRDALSSMSSSISRTKSHKSVSRSNCSKSPSSSSSSSTIAASHPKSSLSPGFSLRPEAVRASASATQEEPFSLQKGVRWYLGAASVAFGSKRVADAIMRRWTNKGEIEALLLEQRAEIQRLHSAHQREVAALKSVYQSHIESLSRNHRDDLLAAAKTVASLTGDLHRALGAMSQTVDMVNKFQADPKAFLAASAKRFTTDSSDQISITLKNLEASLDTLSDDCGVVSPTKSGYLGRSHANAGRQSEKSISTRSRRHGRRSAAAAAAARGPFDESDTDVSLMERMKSVSFSSSSSSPSVSSSSSISEFGSSSEAESTEHEEEKDSDLSSLEESVLSTAVAALPPVKVHTRSKARPKRRHKIRMAVGERSNPVSAKRRRIINAFQFLTRDKEEIEPTLRIIMQMLNNIVSHGADPDAEKYRIVRTGGDIFETHVRFVRGAMEFLSAVGFHEESGSLRFGKSEEHDGLLLDDLRFALDLLSNL